MINMNKIKVVSFGVGVIGSLVAQQILKRKGWIEIVGAVDIDPKKVGRDLGEVVGLGKKLGVTISDDPDEVFFKKDVDVAIHTTSSYFRKVYPELEKIVEYGVNIVSSCEELSYPYIVDEKLAKKLDLFAKKHGATVLGTGINPGFLMDALPITLTGPCLEIKRIKITRRMNAKTRRIPFQKKIGAGMTLEEFEEATKGGKISGHVGLEQSIAMMADALGWKLERIEVEAVEPIILERPVQSNWIRVEPGRVAGMKQTAKGMMNGEPVIELEFIAYIGSEEEYDVVEIDGDPKITSKISPCIHGDYGTIGMLINMIPKVVNAPPGLYVMKDLPLPSAVLPKP
jgi:4-hydroxy-tetrahydrodipicolinate reductase